MKLRSIQNCPNSIPQLDATTPRIILLLFSYIHTNTLPHEHESIFLTPAQWHGKVTQNQRWSWDVSWRKNKIAFNLKHWAPTWTLTLSNWELSWGWVGVWVESRVGHLWNTLLASCNKDLGSPCFIHLTHTSCLSQESMMAYHSLDPCSSHISD